VNPSKRDPPASAGNVSPDEGILIVQHTSPLSFFRKYTTKDCIGNRSLDSIPITCAMEPVEVILPFCNSGMPKNGRRKQALGGVGNK